MTQPVFDLTDSAAKRVAVLASEEEQSGAKLRISVEGGGCSGFQYHFDFVFDEPNVDDDEVIERDGAIVIIDKTSLEFIKGSVLDYVVEMVGARFEIKNPNATANCGCGNSFAVDMF